MCFYCATGVFLVYIVVDMYKYLIYKYQFLIDHISTPIYLTLSTSIYQYIYIDYVNYPQDYQSIQLRVECYGLGGEYVNVNHTGITSGQLIGYSLPTSVTLSKNEGQESIKNNPTWSYDGYSTVVNSVVYATTSGAFSRNEPIIYMNFHRISEGIINRLALPIMLLILLVGLTFWGEHTGRVDSTITILLAISALYIVVFSSIPMLGYLTNFDEYIISVSYTSTYISYYRYISIISPFSIYLYLYIDVYYDCCCCICTSTHIKAYVKDSYIPITYYCC